MSSCPLFWEQYTTKTGLCKGISLLDKTAGTARDITIGDGVNSRTFNLGTTMTAGADLVDIDETIVSVNNTLEGAKINVRMDAINGSVAFTSTIPPIATLATIGKIGPTHCRGAL